MRQRRSPGPTIPTDKELIRILESLSERGAPSQVFDDLVECTALAISNRVRHPDWQAREERYHSIRKQYSPEGFLRVCEAAGLLIQAVMNSGAHRDGEIAGSDVLSRLFMQIGATNGALGQFFTPYAVARCMAAISLGGVREVIEKKGYFTVCEPAAGAGVMLLAAADEIEHQGLDPRKVMYAVARDIDRRAIHELRAAKPARDPSPVHPRRFLSG